MNIKLEPNLHSSPSFSTDATGNSMHHHLHSNRFSHHHLLPHTHMLNANIPAYLHSQTGLNQPNAASLIKEHLTQKFQMPETHHQQQQASEALSKFTNSSPNMNSTPQSQPTANNTSNQTNNNVYKSSQSLSPASSSSSSSSSSISSSSSSSLGNNKGYALSNPTITVNQNNENEEENCDASVIGAHSGEPLIEDDYYVNLNEKSGVSEGLHNHMDMDEDEMIKHDQSDLNEEDTENFEEDYETEYGNGSQVKGDDIPFQDLNSKSKRS